jgi:hypothetical protein
MTSTSFDDIWVPRVGEDATRVLRRHGYLTMFVPFLMLISAAVCGFAFTNGSAGGTVIGLLFLLVGATAFIVWLRSSMQLAEALSAHFGVRIRWTETPSLRVNRFDSWCAKKGFTESK